VTAGDFEVIEDPLRGDAARHDVRETPVIGLMGTLRAAGRCLDMASFGRFGETC